MKIQSTLEFIIILTAVSLFSIFVISQYIPLQNMQKSAFNKLSNQLEYNTIKNSNVIKIYSGNNINITAILPSITYINKSSNIDLIFSYPHPYIIDSIKLNSINAQIYPNDFYSINGSYIQLIQASLIPKIPGYFNVSISITATIANSIKKYNLSLDSFARYVNQNISNNTNKTAVLINNRNESILFNLSNDNKIVNMYEWKHCPYVGVWGNILPEYRQCGYNTYGFMIYSTVCNSGAYTLYVCIKPVNYNFNIQNISDSYSYLYKIDLYTSINNINTITTLSNNYSSNQLISNNNIIGNVKINNFFGTFSLFNQSYKKYVIKNTIYTKYIINSTFYNNYSDNLLKFTTTLVDVNGTSITSNLYSYINSLVSKINYNSSELNIQQAIQINGCRLMQNQFICKSYYPFIYNITENIFNQSINKTVDYEGSIIHII
ncbi:MAG: hypothetical protein ACP5RQ_00665 [Candidatus Micrarchaeia archaeon]